jgi:hypothetical protein
MRKHDDMGSTTPASHWAVKCTRNLTSPVAPSPPPYATINWLSIYWYVEELFAESRMNQSGLSTYFERIDLQDPKLVHGFGGFAVQMFEFGVSTTRSLLPVSSWTKVV